MEPSVTTVIVLDDEEIVGEMIAAVLKTRGYPVLIAARCADAERLIHDHDGRPALLITDIVMPDMTGPEFVRRLRDQGRRLPILYISGYADTAPAETDDVYGRNFLLKPFSAAELVRAVEEALPPNSGG